MEPELLRCHALAKALAERLEIAGLRPSHRAAVALRERIWQELCELDDERQVGDRD